MIPRLTFQLQNFISSSLQTLLLSLLILFSVNFGWSQTCTVDAGEDQEVCMPNHGNEIFLNASFSGGTSGIWTTSGFGFFNDATNPVTTYTVDAADFSGSSVLILTFTINDGGTCEGSVDDVVISSVDNDALVIAGENQEQCYEIDNTPTFSLNGNIGGSATSATWLTSGDGSFSDATMLNTVYTPGTNDLSSGFVTLTLTSNDPGSPDDDCFAAIDIVDLTMSEQISIEAGEEQVLCGLVPGAVIQLDGTVSGNADLLMWTTSGNGTFADASDPKTTYTIGSEDFSTGTFVNLLLSGSGFPPCGTVDDVVVIHSIFVDPGPNQEVCYEIGSTPTFSLNGSINGPSPSGTWSTSGDGSFSDATMLNTVYTPGTNDLSSGSVSLTLTSDDHVGCIGGSNIVDLTMSEQISIEAGEEQVLCGLVPGAVIQLDGTVSGNADLLMWTTSGNGTFADASDPKTTYTIGSEDFSTGTFVNLLLSGSGFPPCGTVDDVVVIHSIFVDPGPNQEVCYEIGSTPTFSLNGSINGPSPSGTWSTSGDGSFSDATMLNTVYTPGTNDLSSGSVSLTLTSDDHVGCIGGSNIVDLTMSEQISIEAGEEQVLCGLVPGAVIQLDGTVSGNADLLMWATSGNGTFADASDPKTTYTIGSEDFSTGTFVNLLLSGSGFPPCGTVDDVVVIHSIFVDPGPNQEVCYEIGSTPTFSLNGSINGPSPSGTWSTSGDGSFSDATMLNTVYTPGTNDLSSGSVSLTLTSDDHVGCIGGSNIVDLTMSEQISIEAGEEQVLCGLVPGAVIQLDGTVSGNADLLMWTTSGNGTFADASDPKTTYTIGSEDFSTGTFVNLLLSGSGFPPCGTVDDFVVISLLPGEPVLTTSSDNCTNVISTLTDDSSWFNLQGPNSTQIGEVNANRNALSSIVASAHVNSDVGTYSGGFFSKRTITVNQDDSGGTPPPLTEPLRLRLYYSETEIDELIASIAGSTIDDLILVKTDDDCSADPYDGSGSTIPYSMDFFDCPTNPFYSLEFEVNDLSTFFLLNPSAILPVELVYFEAEAINNSEVLCTWQTATELNNSHFDVERSQNGIDFEYVGQRSGAGTTDVPQDYQFTDGSPYHGTSFYRLKQVDFDGTTDYSQIRSVYIDKESGIILFPNPAKEIVHVSIPPDVEADSYTIYDTSGKIVGANASFEDSDQLNVDISSLTQETYIFQLRHAGKIVKHIKLVKQ